MDTKLLKSAIIAEYGSQARFAADIGWHPNKVSHLMHGRYIPDVVEAENMAVLLHLSCEMFISIFVPSLSPNGDE